MTVTHDATRQMVAELRHMAGRTGNKQAEKVMRDAASWMEDLNTEFLKATNEVDKLRQKLADKDEQLAGWKTLLDANLASNAAVQNAHARITARKRPSYNYVGTLTDFASSGELTRVIATEKGCNGKKHPTAYYFNERAKDLKIPVVANAAGDYVLLSRTDSMDKEEETDEA